MWYPKSTIIFHLFSVSWRFYSSWSLWYFIKSFTPFQSFRDKADARKSLNLLRGRPATYRSYISPSDTQIFWECHLTKSGTHLPNNATFSQLLRTEMKPVMAGKKITKQIGWWLSNASFMTGCEGLCVTWGASKDAPSSSWWFMLQMLLTLFSDEQVSKEWDLLGDVCNTGIPRVSQMIQGPGTVNLTW